MVEEYTDHKWVKTQNTKAKAKTNHSLNLLQQSNLYMSKVTRFGIGYNKITAFIRRKERNTQWFNSFIETNNKQTNKKKCKNLAFYSTLATVSCPHQDTV